MGYPLPVMADICIAMSSMPRKGGGGGSCFHEALSLRPQILPGVAALRDSRRAATRVPNSPTGQVLEAGPGWPVLVMAMTGPD